MPAEQPPAAREQGDLGDRRGGRRTQVAIGGNQHQVEGDIHGEREEGEPGEIHLAVDGGQRVDEGIVHEKEHHRRGEDAQRRDRLLEATRHVHDGIRRHGRADGQRQAEDGEHLVGLLVGEHQAPAVARCEQREGREDRPHRRLGNPRDGVDVLVGRRVPPDHLEVLEELQQDDVELRVDRRDGEGERERQPTAKQSPDEGRFEPDGDALVPAPANHAEREQAGEEVAGRVDPEKGIPGRPPLDRDERKSKQQQ